MRVLVAMSGGVDSAVAAARLVAAGHQVTGVHLALFRSGRPELVGSRGCCSIADANDARRVAELLDIPFYLWDLSEQFGTAVIDDFLAGYRAGRTPNPCLTCNREIKFAAVLQRGLRLGFDAVATGHYARRVDGPEGPELHRAVDGAKDQSYVLGVLTRGQLARSLFPLGDSTKTAVRAQAAELGLRVAAKPDSTDICFIPDGDTAGFLDRALQLQPGPILDTGGQQVGSHQGYQRYTIGQRRGLRLSRPAEDGRPRYVLDISPATNTITVGSMQELQVSELSAEQVNWLTGRPPQTWRGEVQVRAHGRPAMASCADLGEGRIGVRLDEAMPAPAAGQALVMYQGDRVLGCATLTAAHRPAATPDHAGLEPGAS